MFIGTCTLYWYWNIVADTPPSYVLPRCVVVDEVLATYPGGVQFAVNLEQTTVVTV